MKPAKSILDPSFKYVSSAKTDLAKTFRRIVRERQSKPLPPAPNVVRIRKQQGE